LETLLHLHSAQVVTWLRLEGSLHTSFSKTTSVKKALLCKTEFMFYMQNKNIGWEGETPIIASVRMNVLRERGFTFL